MKGEREVEKAKNQGDGKLSAEDDNEGEVSPESVCTLCGDHPCFGVEMQSSLAILSWTCMAAGNLTNSLDS